MKAIKTALAIFLFIVFGLFMVGFRMTPAPGTSSGNGNPALILLIGLIPLFLIITVLWWSWLRFYAIQAKMYLVAAVILIAHLAAAFFYRHHSLQAHRETIRQALLDRNSRIDEQYVESITTGLSIHINNQNFNVNTFFMFLSATLLAAILFRLWDCWDKSDSQKQSQ
ncbi:hypothetical protein [Domibacillus robiginosus]|uniref:hypothetical protein n=1 Tax=Domibacillus robiginosus TaxID=1071054 RepID=UPI00067B467A|nr:hypothetical protein [Domibacillus robiginosus]